MTTRPTIIATWAESAAGPGWSNTPIRYLTKDGNGKLGTHVLQPEQQSNDMRAMYTISEHCNQVLIRGVSDALYPVRKRKPKN